MRNRSSLVALGAAVLLLGAVPGCVGGVEENGPSATAPEGPAAAPPAAGDVEPAAPAETPARLGPKADREPTGVFEGDREPIALFGLRSERLGADVAGARKFVVANARALGVTGDLQDVTAEPPVDSLTGRHIVLRQTYDGIPVEGAEVRVHFNHEGEVVAASSTYESGVTLPSVEPAIPHDVAVGVARTILPGDADAARDAPAGELVVLADAGSAALAWRVDIATSGASWEVFVDARDGSILRAPRDVNHYATGKVTTVNAIVATQNPLLEDGGDAASAVPAEAYSIVTLLGLTSNRYLDGQYASTSATKRRAAANAQGNFLFDRSSDGFSEVMAYYYVDRSQRHLQSLGFTNVNNRQQVIDAAAGNFDNAFYSPKTRRLEFGEGGVDDAEDGDVICHEYGHSIQDNQVPGFGSSLEAGSMGEGFGDYWAGTMGARISGGYEDLCLAEWDASAYSETTPPCLRRLDSTKHYPQSKVGEVHADGEMWSAALWQIRGALGADLADKVIIEAHFHLPGKAASFNQGASALAATAAMPALGLTPAQILAVRTILENRGFTVQ